MSVPSTLNLSLSKNIVITGFMGTGKTSVGRAVAAKLARTFVDMDVEIEARTGKPIARFFAEDGEPAFRQIEAALCEELCARDGLVIATGGGALVNPANRARMMASGAVVCLSCDVDEILRRVDGNVDRPLLAVADRRAQIEQLLRARRGVYAAIPWQIDTTALTVEEVTDQVIGIANVITLPVHHPEGQYDIHIGNGTLKHIGGALRAISLAEGSRVAIVSNTVVAPLYARQVEASLQSAGGVPFVCSIPDGERYKTLAIVASLYDQFLAGGLDRSGTVLALGGGVTGDVAGLAAATFMRGVRFVQVPTTLLAMVDASVGGKTGVDLPQGKNLVGAFKQPALVLIDPAVLATLPADEFRSGMAEMIKHGVIGDVGLLAELASGRIVNPQDGSSRETNRQGKWAERIAQALRVKIAVVEQDPFEQGRRAVLNLGHTVGHALEKLSDFNLRHGEAVSIGMVAAAKIAVELGRADASLIDRVEAVLSAWELPVRCPPFDADAILAAMTHDKKKQGHGLRWVLPRAIGQVEIAADVPLQVVRSVLCSLGARSEA
jgi:shikimate kinase / 3-dehydroquinate synthase